jgi:hypothetical protein
MSKNPALDIANQANNATTEYKFNKILSPDAPALAYLGGNKGPSKFIIPYIPTSDNTLTYGMFVDDKARNTGMLPVLGDYALDWVYIYQNIGLGDSSQRMSILAINTVVDEETGEEKVIAEQSWGRGYQSPMYKLQEYLWKASGSPKFNKRANKVETTSPVIHADAESILPYGSPIDAPMRRGTRCLLIQGFVMENAGTNYLVNAETGEAQWPQHRVFLVNQVTAINSAPHMDTKVGFYDKFLMKSGEGTTNPTDVRENYGDVINDVDARRKWEADTFVHHDYAKNLKLVEFTSKPSGAAGITAYSSQVDNLTDVYANYQMPQELFDSVKPIGDYLYKSTWSQQVEWMKELFVGAEWALIGAGIMEDTPTQVAVPSVPPVTTAAAPTPTSVTPVEPTAPTTPPAPAAPPAAGMPPAGAIPAPSATPTPTTPTPATPSPADGNEGNLDTQMQEMMSRLQNLQDQQNKG